MHETNKNVTEKQENYASEVFRFVTSRLCMIIAGLMLIIAIGFITFYMNDNKWRAAFTSLGFISQDGIIKESEE